MVKVRTLFSILRYTSRVTHHALRLTRYLTCTITVAIQVYVGEQYCGEVKYQASQSEYNIDCGGMVGGEVKILGLYSYLTLCEVEVYGSRVTSGGGMCC